MKKKKTILAAAILLFMFVIGGAIAYFTDTDTKTNTDTIPIGRCAGITVCKPIKAMARGRTSGEQPITVQLRYRKTTGKMRYKL